MTRELCNPDSAGASWIVPIASLSGFAILIVVLDLSANGQKRNV